MPFQPPLARPPARCRFQPGMLNADTPLTQTTASSLSLPLKPTFADVDRTIVEKEQKGNWILYYSENCAYNVFDEMPELK